MLNYLIIGKPGTEAKDVLRVLEKTPNNEYLTGAKYSIVVYYLLDYA